jgi:hypothetical protein
MLWAILTVGRSLGVQGYVTISIFFATELTSLIIYIINFPSEQADTQIGPIADLIL